MNDLKWPRTNSRDILSHWFFLLLQNKPNICYEHSKNSLFNYGPITGEITGYYVTGWCWSKTDSGNGIFESCLPNKTIFNRSERYNKRKLYNFNFCQKSENFQNAITFFPQLSSTNGFFNLDAERAKFSNSEGFVGLDCVGLSKIIPFCWKSEF